MRVLSFVVACLMGMASMGVAATLNETDILNGFSSQFGSATQIGLGNDQVNGTLTAGDFDFLHFTNLAAGSQSIDFTFGLPVPGFTSGFQNIGGQAFVSETQPGFASDGARLNPLSPNNNDFELFFDPFNAASAVTTQTLSYQLDSSFQGGSLFVALLPQFSSNTPFLTYSLSVPGNAVAPVPVPASGLLLLAALGAGGMLRHRQRPAKHPSPA